MEFNLFIYLKFEEKSVEFGVKFEVLNSIFINLSCLYFKENAQTSLNFNKKEKATTLFSHELRLFFFLSGENMFSSESHDWLTYFYWN